MYLKSLEVQGFKSFPDKTILNFGDDITAIVGPNGAGKSNISDAIRWVMGEQSTRALRGGKMEDVIFGGTQKRAQVGFAEASLTLDNADGSLPVDAPEITVTRRYYRSGESEYYINRQSARLRDINELFMDTGLGREGYSNISQGRIDEILSAKSVDRREIFEEAAGISKYRHRKEETERRLAHTEENLLRIGDKISELELQVEPLREQAEKAQKYLTFRDELKGLEVAVWLESLQKLAVVAQKAEADYNSAAFVLTQEHEALDGLYQRAEELGEQLHERDLGVDAMRDGISAEEAERERCAGQIAVLETERDNTEDNLRRVREEAQEQESRSGGLLAQIETAEARVREVEDQSAALERQLQTALDEAKRLADSADDMTRQFLELRNRESELSAQIAGRAADLTALDDALARTLAREDEVRGDRDAAAAREAETNEKLAACRKALQQAREQAQSCANTISGYTLRQKAREEKAEALQKTQNERTVALDTVSSRLRMLQEMEREYEGYTKAVKFVMQEAGRGALRGVHGPVSRLIRTDEPYAVAIEIALGGATQHIVVSDEQDAKYAIRLLKQRDMGRATFLPLNAIEGRTLQERGLEQCAGFVGLASSLVRYDTKYRAIVENLLGRTVICRSLDEAISMAQRYDRRFRIVTLDGQVMNAGGSMTGGSVSRSAGMLSRAGQIERLAAEQAELKQALDENGRALAEARRAAEEVRFSLLTAQGQLREAEDDVLRLEGEEKQYAALAEAITDAAQSSARELAALAERRKADETRKTELGAQQALLSEQRGALTRQLETLTAGQEAASARSDQMAERITALRMEAAGLHAEKVSVEDNIRRLRELSAAMQGDRAQKLSLAEEYERQLETRRAQIVQAQEALARQAEKVEAGRAALQQALAERQQVEAQKTRTEKDAQQKSADILLLEREKARLEARRESAHLEEKQIIDKLWDSYELTPSLAPTVAAPIESVNAANRRVAELRRKIGALGTPNLGAIDEYARVSERYEYLTGQRDDVLHAKRELEGVIREITGHMTEIFTEEFAKINRYFGETFTEMFGGGKASLTLEDPEEPLSCGIEINVQPPGKQLKTITLLSGGEKAFVAIALYFAILKVRPTPFCMLDEIDAALDDRNVERFAHYLRGLSGKTQFIVITHRRGTMEEADMLFGVTMQEQGISKILHLDLDQLEQQLGIVE